jgi:hypothetical protein
VVTGRLRSALDPLTSVDALLERWQNQGSIEEAGRYRLPEIRLYAGVLGSRARLAEARNLYQIVFERTQPRHRRLEGRSPGSAGAYAVTGWRVLNVWIAAVEDASVMDCRNSRGEGENVFRA